MRPSPRQSPSPRAPTMSTCPQPTPHERRRRTLLKAVAGLAGALACARPATGAGTAAFPAHPVRIVVPYSVGVGPDVVARSVAERLSQAWGQPVIVDNRPGASGIVAFGDVRQA